MNPYDDEESHSSIFLSSSSWPREDNTRHEESVVVVESPLIFCNKLKVRPKRLLVPNKLVSLPLNFDNPIIWRNSMVKGACAFYSNKLRTFHLCRLELIA